MRVPDELKQDLLICLEYIQACRDYKTRKAFENLYKIIRRSIRSYYDN